MEMLALPEYISMSAPVVLNPNAEMAEGEGGAKSDCAQDILKFANKDKRTKR
jgi:hypothetical protein